MKLEEYTPYSYSEIMNDFPLTLPFYFYRFQMGINHCLFISRGKRLAAGKRVYSLLGYGFDDLLTPIDYGTKFVTYFSSVYPGEVIREMVLLIEKYLNSIDVCDIESSFTDKEVKDVVS